MSYTILDRIFEAKRSRVEAAKAAVNAGELKERAFRYRRNRAANAFRKAIARNSSINIIAEFKRASPSKGELNVNADPAIAAAAYARGGAKAISVLTEEDFFRGSMGDLEAVRQATSLPILRKDFIFDKFQISEAAAGGADAVLLIAAALNDAEVSELSAEADELGLDALVEVHTKDEMARAARLGVELIGVNNRDLGTFEVSLDVSRELVQYAPGGAFLIAESGLTRRGDLLELSKLGFDGFLIGETLMRSEDPESELKNLIGDRR